ILRVLGGLVDKIEPAQDRAGLVGARIARTGPQRLRIIRARPRRRWHEDCRRAQKRAARKLHAGFSPLPAPRFTCARLAHCGLGQRFDQSILATYSGKANRPVLVRFVAPSEHAMPRTSALRLKPGLGAVEMRQSVNAWQWRSEILWVRSTRFLFGEPH